jgi:hypothetical protein
MIFSCNPHWIEEICDTPAELLASRDPTGANAEEAPGPPAESECPTFQSTSIKERERISSIN